MGHMVTIEMILQKSQHAPAKRRGILFPPHRHLCSSLLLFKHSFQAQPWPSCPCSLCPHGMEFLSLMEEHPGLFSAGMLEKQEDHQLGL